VGAVKPPPGRSVAGIALQGGGPGARLFIARRLPGGSLGGLWEFPGGKAEPGETDEAALVREYQEEFGVTVTPGPFLAEGAFEHRGRPYTLRAYRVSFDPAGLVPREHSAWRWASWEELDALTAGAERRFVDSDRALLPALRAALG